MGTARLVLIEGMIGSGKTTTATWLAGWLASQGDEVRMFAEGAADHPVKTRAEDRLRAEAGFDADRPDDDEPVADGPVADGPDPYGTGQWRRLAESCLRGPRTVILEASFLQNSVMPAFIEGRPASTVTESFDQIQNQVAPAEPLLVYLRPADIRGTIAGLHRSRGEPWSAQNLAFVSGSAWARRRGLAGLDAVVGLYEAWEPVVAGLYERYRFGKIMVTDPQRDWPGSLARIGAAARGTEQLHDR
jgi:hypothetical protein